jgi:hypothetical protein
MSNPSSPAEVPSEAIRHVCPENGSTACRASNRSSLTDIRGMRIKHTTTASVMAVAMDTFTVPLRTPKYAVASRTSESRIQTRLEKSSKITFYAIEQRHSRTQENPGSIAWSACSSSWRWGRGINFRTLEFFGMTRLRVWRWAEAFKGLRVAAAEIILKRQGER